MYDTIVGYVDILDEVHFEIEFTIHSWPIGDWGNIFQCGNKDDERYPALSLHPNSGVDGNSYEGLYVAVSGDDRYVGGIMGDYLKLDISYRVDVVFTQDSFTVIANNEILQDAVYKRTHTVRYNVPCYCSFPDYQAANVTITTLFMTSTNATDEGLK